MQTLYSFQRTYINMERIMPAQRETISLARIRYDGESCLPEDTHLYASDLTMLEDEAKQLENGIHPYAEEIAKQADLSKTTLFSPHAQRLEAISQFHGYSSYSEVYQRLKSLLEYRNHNRRSGNWLRGPQVKEWDRNVFTKQYAALVNSVVKKTPFLKLLTHSE